MRRTLLSPVVASALCAALLTACDQANNPPANPSNSNRTASSTAAPSTTTPSWILAAAPADAVPVATLKASATEGQHVVIRGRIGGRRDPISADSPVLIIMDPAVPACSDSEAATCSTPWDYCCETPASIAANNATIQVVDAAGEPIAGSLAASGLEPLAEIIVVGVVGARPDPSVLTIRATGIHRVRPRYSRPSRPAGRAGVARAGAGATDRCPERSVLRSPVAPPHRSCRATLGGALVGIIALHATPALAIGATPAALPRCLHRTARPTRARRRLCTQ